MDNIQSIQNLIYEVRDYKVMLDSDLALLYGVSTKILNQAVKRNLQRFPKHYMFQLTQEEYKTLRSQFVTSSIKHGGRRYLPYVFTEQGVAMLSSVLGSEKAIQINIQIIDTFVKVRHFALENKELSNRMADLEHYFMEHCKDYQADMKDIYQAIDLLMDRTKPLKIGYIREEDK